MPNFNINLFQMERSSFENKHLIKNIIIGVVYVLQNPFGLICTYRLNEIFFQTCTAQCKQSSLAG